ncbi:MAG: glycosyltransferase [Proteobacteria bacterium]|nr:glycosyltransferase [Pseudomonadota bacterium]
MRLLQAIGGGPQGGAENFFMRLAPQLENFVSQEVFIRNQGQRIKALEDAGLKVIEGSFTGILGFKTRFQFFQEIRQFHPDIVLTWMNRATFLCPSSKIFRKFLPSFLHVGRLGGFYNLKYYRNCDALIGNTKGIVSYLIENGWSSENVFYLPNFVNIPDLSTISSLCKTDIEGAQKVPIILTAGRLHGNKAIDTLIRAMVFINEASLWILGEGPQEKYLKKLAEDIGVSHRVRFLGWQENVSQFYKAATVFVCPSRHEPLGNVILEAWAHKCPVIAAASSGPQELIKSGTTGLLFPIDNVSALVDCLKETLYTENFRKKLQEEGRKFVEENFSKEKVVGEYLSCFEFLLKHRKGK